MSDYTSVLSLMTRFYPDKLSTSKVIFLNKDIYANRERVKESFLRRYKDTIKLLKSEGFVKFVRDKEQEVPSYKKFVMKRKINISEILKPEEFMLKIQNAYVQISEYEDLKYFIISGETLALHDFIEKFKKQNKKLIKDDNFMEPFRANGFGDEILKIKFDKDTKIYRNSKQVTNIKDRRIRTIKMIVKLSFFKEKKGTRTILRLDATKINFIGGIESRCVFDDDEYKKVNLSP